MVAVPIPLPLPPPVNPGAWDPDRPNPYTGPSVEELWRRMKEGVGSQEGIKVEPDVKAKEADCSQTSNQNECNQCKLAQGMMVPANYSIPHKQYEDFDYQLRIANMKAAPERYDYTYGGATIDRTRLKLLGGKNEITVTEWMHADPKPIRFDGFWRSLCTAVEAKGNYAQFFDKKGRPHAWLKSPNVSDSWVIQASKQNARITLLGSPAKLEWHFMQAICYQAAKRSFGPNTNLCRYTP